ncbi:MAG: DUF4421 family protein [Prevotella sp.]|nr:DUF4421 family protein [Prevotella sp.]
MSKKSLLLLLLLPMFMATDAVGQDVVSLSKKALSLADSLLKKKYYSSDIDSNYIVRPSTRFTLKARGNLSGATVVATGMVGSRQFRAEEWADFKHTINFSGSYMGLSLGLSMNPGLLLGHYKDYELNINSYGNKFGFDVVYQQAKNFKGWMDFGVNGEWIRDDRIDLPRDMLTLRTLNVNAYYAFNNRRFSYPAAFSQSYIQVRSAGSFMIAASYQGQSVETKALESIGNRSARLQVGNLAAGAGYGYNFVLPHSWLLHISALPTIIFFSHNRFYLDDERQTMHNHFPEVIITGRGAFVHSFDNYFLGLSMVYNFSRIGDVDRLEIMNSKWRARAFLGIRF